MAQTTGQRRAQSCAVGGGNLVVFKRASCLRVFESSVLSKLVQVVASLAFGKRHQARDWGVVVAGEGEPSFGGPFIGWVFEVRPVFLLVNRHLTKPLVRTDDSRFLSRDLLLIVCWLPPHTGSR